jgi:hypothetical protein
LTGHATTSSPSKGSIGNFKNALSSRVRVAEDPDRSARSSFR